MKRPWAFICASEGATSKHLRNYCREVYLLGYLPVCPKLQDSQYLVLEDAVERSEYTAIVRDKLLRCPMLVVCSRNQDATTNAQIGLAQMLANSEFLVMLNQSATDREELAKLLNISDNQLGYVTNVPAGCGLIRCAGNIVPFTNSFPKNTKLYGLMTTKPDEVRKE